METLLPYAWCDTIFLRPPGPAAVPSCPRWQCGARARRLHKVQRPIHRYGRDGSCIRPTALQFRGLPRPPLVRSGIWPVSAPRAQRPTSASPGAMLRAVLLLRRGAQPPPRRARRRVAHRAPRARRLRRRRRRLGPPPPLRGGARARGGDGQRGPQRRPPLRRRRPSALGTAHYICGQGWGGGERGREGERETVSQQRNTTKNRVGPRAPPTRNEGP